MIFDQGKNQGTKKLALTQLRALERALGVIIDEPKKTVRSAEQQFGIYDEDGVYAGDIRAADLFFTKEELRIKILDLFHKNITDYLTFDELAKGDRFIILPGPADNAGHMGLKEPQHIFRKSDHSDAIREKDNAPAIIPLFMPVFKVE